jgi:hypothetical protein
MALLVFLLYGVLSCVIGLVDLSCLRRGESPIFHNRLLEALVPSLNAERMARFALATGALALLGAGVLAVARWIS